MGSKKKEKVPLCQEKKKNFFVKATSTSGAPRRRRFRIQKSPSNQTLPCIMLKTRFPFLYASTSLDTKTLTIASNRNLKSCLSIRCLTPQHILRFFLFLPRLSPLPLAALLIVVSFSSTFHWAIAIKKIKLVWNELLFPGNLDILSLTLGGQFCSCCGIRYPINSLDEPFVVSRIIGFWHFLKRKVA